MSSNLTIFYTLSVMLFLVIILLTPANPVSADTHIYVNGYNYTEFRLGDLRVIIVDARTPNYVIRYKGVNYIDYNTSDDYSNLGPVSIPGVNMSDNARNLNLTAVSRALEPFRGVVLFWNNSLTNWTLMPSVMVYRDFAALEVIVRPRIDPVNASREIALALKPLLLENGYHTLIVVRALSDSPPERLSRALEAFHYTLLQPTNNTANDTPLYLKEIMKLAKEYPDRMYFSIGVGVYGSIVVEFWGPKPDKTMAIQLAKWMRDKTEGNYSDVPIYLVFHSEQPPKLALMTLTINTSNTTTGTAKWQTTTTDILAISSTIVFVAGIVAVILFRKQ